VDQVEFLGGIIKPTLTKALAFHKKAAIAAFRILNKGYEVKITLEALSAERLSLI
jgi:hypothetical protein